MRAIMNAMPAFPVGDPAGQDRGRTDGVAETVRTNFDVIYARASKKVHEVLIGGEGHRKVSKPVTSWKPTVFVNVKNDMAIAQEEIFGPVPVRHRL